MLEKNSIRYLSSTLLGPFEPVAHAFLSRKGGVSGPPFDELNFDLREGDTEASVKANMALVSEAFGIRFEGLFTVSQVHGNRVHLLDGGQQGNIEADAIITEKRGVPIGIMTADCLPVLFYDTAKGAIGAAHAGWKGTVETVCIETVRRMGAEFGSRPADIIAALGPYIGPCCYSVRENVVEAFARFGTAPSYIKAEGGSTRLDIGRANVEQLLSAGVPENNISIESACTACQNADFFSYRKDGARTGRQMSFIMLK